MSIYGIGTEIVECLRIGRMIEQHGELFLARVFTEREILDSQSKKRAIQQFASLWAAKEAIVKSLGQPWHKDLPFTDIEIQYDKVGNPVVVVNGAIRERCQSLGVGSFLLSFSNCRAYAVAYAMAMRS